MEIDLDKFKNSVGDPEYRSGSQRKKWSDQDLINIYKLRQEGYSVSQLADELNVSYYVITTNTQVIKRAIRLIELLKKEGLIPKSSDEV